MAATPHKPDNAVKAPREPWIIRTYAGFGDARQANERFLANLKAGPARTFDRVRPADPERLRPRRSGRARRGRRGRRFDLPLAMTWSGCSREFRCSRSTPR